MNKELIYYLTLRRIANYMDPLELLRRGDKLFGVSGEEAIKMAYENVLEEARSVISGNRNPKPLESTDVGCELGRAGGDRVRVTIDGVSVLYPVSICVGNVRFGISVEQALIISKQLAYEIGRCE